MTDIERQFLNGERTLGEAIDAVLVACRMPALREAVTLHGGLEGAAPGAPRGKAGRKPVATDTQIVDAVNMEHRAGAPLVDPIYPQSAFSIAGENLKLSGETIKKRFYAARGLAVRDPHALKAPEELRRRAAGALASC
jgi:hypothetical protein